MNSRSNSSQFEVLLRPHLESLYRLAYRLTGSRVNAEDLVQDVLTKIFPRTEEMARISNLRPWLARVLYNQFIDDRRSASRSPLQLVVDNTANETEDDAMESIAVNHDGPAQLTERHQQQHTLQDAINSLGEDQRIVLMMHDVEGYTISELIEILACPAGTLKSRLHRARAALREQLKSAQSGGHQQQPGRAAALPDD